MLGFHNGGNQYAKPERQAYKQQTNQHKQGKASHDRQTKNKVAQGDNGDGIEKRQSHVRGYFPQNDLQGFQRTHQQGFHGAEFLLTGDGYGGHQCRNDHQDKGHGPRYKHIGTLHVFVVQHPDLRSDLHGSVPCPVFIHQVLLYDGRCVVHNKVGRIGIRSIREQLYIRFFLPDQFLSETRLKNNDLLNLSFPEFLLYLLVIPEIAIENKIVR